MKNVRVYTYVCVCVRVLKYTRDAILYAAYTYIHIHTFAGSTAAACEKRSKNEMKILHFAGGTAHPRGPITRLTEQMLATQFVSRQRRSGCQLSLSVGARTLLPK